MKISVFGLGFIGSVTAVCLAELGHEVIATDINHQLLSDLQQGGNPFNEPEFDTLLKKHISRRNISFSEDIKQLINQSDCSFITVDTPSRADGTVNLDSLNICIASIAHIIKMEKPYTDHLLVVKSTIPNWYNSHAGRKVWRIDGTRRTY